MIGLERLGLVRYLELDRGHAEFAFRIPTSVTVIVVESIESLIIKSLLLSDAVVEE